MQSNLSSTAPTTPPSPSFHFWGNSWQEKLPVIIVAIVVVGIVAAILVSRGVLKTPFPQAPKQSQPLTDEQKLQMLKNLSGNSSAAQPSDQEKLQALQKLSAPQKNASNAPQPSDAEKLRALQQLSGK